MVLRRHCAIVLGGSTTIWVLRRLRHWSTLPRLARSVQARHHGWTWTRRCQVPGKACGLETRTKVMEEGRRRKRRREKESSKEKKDPGRIPVFIRSLTGRTLNLLITPLHDVSTLLSLVEGLVHIPRHLWYVRAIGKPLPDLFMPHGLLRDEVVTMPWQTGWRCSPTSCPRGVVLPGVSAGRVLAGETVLFSVWMPSQGF